MDLTVKLGGACTGSAGRNGEAGAPVRPELSARLALVSDQAIVEAWLAGRTETTRDAYARDLATFAEWLGVETAGAAADLLLCGSSAEANRLAFAYRASMVERGLSPSTVNRRLSSLRSLAKLARVTGRSTVTIDVESLRRRKYRDMRGPDSNGVRAMYRAVAAAPDSPKRRRNLAILRLAGDLGLRKCEILRLDVTDIEVDRILVQRKGLTAQREPLPLVGATRAALADWLEVRDPRTAAVFHGLSSRSGGGVPKRLDGSQVWRIVSAAGRAAGLDRPVWPHALRHSAITTALDAGHDIRQVRHLSGHTSFNSLIDYEDRHRDHAKAVALSVLAENGGPTPPPQS